MKVLSFFTLFFATSLATTSTRPSEESTSQYMTTEGTATTRGESEGSPPTTNASTQGNPDGSTISGLPFTLPPPVEIDVNAFMQALLLMTGGDVLSLKLDLALNVLPMEIRVGLYIALKELEEGNLDKAQASHRIWKALSDAVEPIVILLLASEDIE